MAESLVYFYVVQPMLDNTDLIGGNNPPLGPISWLCLTIWPVWSKLMPIWPWPWNGCKSLPSSNKLLCTSLEYVTTGRELVLPVVWHYETMGRSSVCWVSLCLLRSTFLWNARPQRSQAKGLKPVCFLECVIRFDDWLNALPQTVHLWGFSPVT